MIPHGTTWGFYTPPGSSWDKQLTAAEDDPDRQTLLEIYSGHGNSDEYRDFRAVRFDENGEPVLPRADAGLPPHLLAGGRDHPRSLPRGGTGGGGVRARGPSKPGPTRWPRASRRTSPCRAPVPRTGSTRASAATATSPPSTTAPRARPSTSWRSGTSTTRPAQARPLRLHELERQPLRPGRDGLQGDASTREHRVPGAGPARRPTAVAAIFARPPEEPVAESRPFDFETTELSGFQLFETERQASFFLTGGLVAVHAEGRDREAIWQALTRKEVYGTSGPRILLWFHLLNPPGSRGAELPMGGQTEMSSNPIFRVRAVGSFEQQPGCPEYAVNSLSERAAAAPLQGGVLQPLRPAEAHHPHRAGPHPAPEPPRRAGGIADRVPLAGLRVRSGPGGMFDHLRGSRLRGGRPRHPLLRARRRGPGAGHQRRQPPLRVRRGGALREGRPLQRRRRRRRRLPRRARAARLVIADLRRLRRCLFSIFIRDLRRADRRAADCRSSGFVPAISMVEAADARQSDDLGAL